MAFNLQDFNAKINSLGVAKTNLFYANFSFPAGVGDLSNEDLSFMCRTANIPSLSVGTSDFKPLGIGTPTRIPTAIEFQPISVVFYVDSKYRVLKTFHSWMQKIVNYDKQAGPNSTSGGLRVFEFNYHNEYSGAMALTLFSDNVDSSEYSYQYVFQNLYPINVGEITVAWENAAEVMLLPVTFTYDSMIVDGATSGTAT